MNPGRDGGDERSYPPKVRLLDRSRSRRDRAMLAATIRRSAAGLLQSHGCKLRDAARGLRVTASRLHYVTSELSRTHESRRNHDEILFAQCLPAKGGSGRFVTLNFDDQRQRQRPASSGRCAREIVALRSLLRSCLTCSISIGSIDSSGTDPLSSLSVYRHGQDKVQSRAL